MEADAFIDAALGQIFLTAGSNEKAVGRLEAAFREFPEVGFLGTLAAEANLEAKDPRRAQRFVDQAKGLEMPAPYRRLDRIQADIHRVHGRPAKAREIYLDLITSPHGGEFARYGLGLLEAEAGRYVEALAWLREAHLAYPTVVRFRQGFLNAARDWWAQLRLHDRVGVVAGAACGDRWFPATVPWQRQAAKPARKTPPLATLFDSLLSGGDVLGSLEDLSLTRRVMKVKRVPRSWSLALAGWCLWVDSPLQKALGRLKPGVAALASGLTPALLVAASLVSQAQSQALVPGSYLGGTKSDGVVAATSARNGDLIVVGHTDDAAFPYITRGSFQPSIGGGDDAFVVRLDVRVQPPRVVWGTYLGAAALDYPVGVAVDHRDRICVVGTTLSKGFPTTRTAYQRALLGSRDCFIAVLGSNGRTLHYSTLLGGNSTSVEPEAPSSMCLDAQGRIVVVGQTGASNFPVRSPWRVYGGRGSTDGFVSIVDPSASGSSSLVYSSLTGISANDYFFDVEIVGPKLLLVGHTHGSPNLGGSTSTQYRSGSLGASDVLVVMLDPSRTGLAQRQWSHLLGGRGWEHGESVTTDRNGDILIAANSVRGSGWRTSAGAFQPVARSGNEMTITRLSANGNVIKHATYLGGSNLYHIGSIEVDAAGRPIVSAITRSTNHPTTATAFARRSSGGFDVVLSCLSYDLSTLEYSTYFGGPADDGSSEAQSLVMLSSGKLLLSGRTSWASMPVGAKSLQPKIGGGTDGFLATFDPLTKGVTRFGVGTPSCHGAMCVFPTHAAVLNGAFGWVCSNAPRNYAGVLMIGTQAKQPYSLLGARFETTPALLLPASSDSQGEHRFSLPTLPVAAGNVAVQYAWLNPPNCRANGLLSSSYAIRF